MEDDFPFVDDPYSRPDAEECAEKKGLIVVRPKPNELFVDIDDEPSLAIFTRNIKRIGQTIGCTHVRRRSPSGASGRLHIVVKLNRDVRDAFERITLQALIGSDRIHEALSWQAAVRGDEYPTVFFEKPGKEA
jgi:hypothetical protein